MLTEKTPLNYFGIDVFCNKIFGEIHVRKDEPENICLEITFGDFLIYVLIADYF